MSNVIVNSYRFAEAALTNTKSWDGDGTDNHMNITGFGSSSADGVISFWVYLDNTTNIVRALHITESTFSSNNQFFINLRSTGSSNPLDIEARSRIGGTNHWHYKWNTSVTASSWHHIMIGSDGVAPYCYHNQTLITTITKDVTTDESKWFGDWNTASMTKWVWGAADTGSILLAVPGALNNMCVWETEEDVNDLVLSGSPRDLTNVTGFGTNCLAWWQCGDGSGDDATNVFDQANSNDLTHQNNDADPYRSAAP